MTTVSLELSTISALMRRVSARDPAAFADLVATFDADMVRLSLVVCGDAETARDAVQNVWHRVWMRPPSLADPTRIRMWLLKAAGNEARQALRRQRIGVRRERQVAALEPAERDHAAEIDLAVLLSRMDLEDRELLALRYLFEKTSDEIGEYYGITGAGVRSRLRRLLADMRKELQT